MSRLRIASYYENRLGRNDGNPLYMHVALGAHPGIEAGHLIPNGDLTKYGTWDLHFEADWGEDALYEVLPYKPCDIPKPSVFWHSDTHMGYEWRLEKAKRTDFNLCCQKRAVEDFKRDGIPNPIFMPHAVEPKAYPNIQAIKKYDICFLGHISTPERIDLLDVTFKEFKNFWYGQRRFEEAAEQYGKTKICLNHSIKDDINMRTFEVMATGSFLLTSDIPTLHDLFEDGKHCVMYKDHADMIEKAHYYIDHDDEREAIAKAGQAETLKNHTFKNRVEQVLEVTGLAARLKEPATV